MSLVAPKEAATESVRKRPPICSPLVTAGVKRAVGLLVRWLEAQGLETAHSSY